MKTLFVHLALAAALGGLLTSIQPALAQGTAFTYQGQLSSNGVSLNGKYDFQFSFYPNAAGTGSPLGTSPITQTGIGVTNGLFTVTLDFGPVFTGNATWLAISVRSNGSGAGFTALTPLQELTPTPYAIYTPNAGNAATATSATSAATAAMASNVTSGIAITNAVITNSVFEGNGGGLTNLNASQLTSIGGSLNFFVGPAGNATTSGLFNTAAGIAALANNTSGNFNTATGYNALPNNTSGYYNTATGAQALTINRSGSYNTAMGFEALNLLGAVNAAGGSNNIALGYDAGSAYTGNESSNIDIGHSGVAGENNIIRIGSNQVTAYIAGVITGNGSGLTNLTSANLTGALPAINGANLTNLSGAQLTSYGNALSDFFVGFAGNATTSGEDNTAIGNGALLRNTSGGDNTANGYNALLANLNGSDNTAMGFNALQDNTNGGYNTALGANALFNNLSGWDNTAIGASVLLNNLSGFFNTAIGYYALQATNGSNNIALGYYAGSAYTGNESSNIDIGHSGVAGENNIIRIGSNQVTAYIAGVITGNGSGLTNLTSANLTGALPAINGANLTNLTAANITSGGTLPALNGANLTSLNPFQLTLSPSGDGNFFLGSGGNATTSGEFNTASGLNALAGNTTGNDNTAYGSGVLHANSTGSDNTAYGFNSLHVNSTGSNNTATGSGALANNTTGSNNIALGFNAGNNLSTTSSNIDIGNLGSAGDQNTIRIGSNQTATYIAGISGITAASGVEVFVNSSGQLGTATSSVRFKKDIQSMDDASDVLLALHPVKFKYKTELDPQGLPQFGLVAEEVDKVDPDLVARDDKGNINTVRYNAVNAMLLNEFLKQHRNVQEQSVEIEKLKEKADKVDSLEKQLNELQQMVQLLAGRK